MASILTNVTELWGAATYGLTIVRLSNVWV